jgi:uncharacterized protein YciI
MKYLVYYEAGPEAAAKIPLHDAAHRSWWGQFRERGTLLAVGPFSDSSGALAVFTTREAAQEFVDGDPFVMHGAMQTWSIREWNETLL